MKIFFLVLMILSVFISPIHAQTGVTSTVNGFVYDKSTGESLIGAAVTLFGNGVRTGNFTNTNGYFIIPDAPVGKDTIVVSYAGYDPWRSVIMVGGPQSGLQKFYLTQSSYKSGEVVVVGDSASRAQKAFERPVSVLELTPHEVLAIPKVVEADLLRALQSMPGITALSDFSSAIYVRGGTPDENLYLVDGAEVYDPEHAFGIFSTFNTDAIKEVDVSKGGFGPQYDDRLSAVVDVIDKEGNRNHFQGTFDLSLIAANLTLQVPLGSLGSISGSFRRTYLDQTVAKWDSNIPPYYFFDGNLKAFLQLSDEDVLTVSYFGSGDNLNFQTEQGDPQSSSVLLTWGNTLGSMNWKHLFGEKIYSSLYLTYSGFSSNFTSTSQSASNSETNPLHDYTGREALTYYLSDEMIVEGGAEYKKLSVSFNRNSNSGIIDLSDGSHETSAFLEFRWQPDPLWQVNAGLRFERSQSDTTYTHFDPRFSVQYRLSESSSLKLAAGVYHQYMEAVERPFAPDVWLPSDNSIYDSRCDHLILGYEQQVADLLDLDVETYYKNYKNLYIYNYNDNAEESPSSYTTTGIPVYTSSKNVFLRGDGRSFGIELLLRKDIGAVTGWIGYALSKTEDIFDGVNQGNSFVPQQERTSVVNFTLNGNINSIFSGRWNDVPTNSSSNWILGLNFIFTSGQPITLPSSAYFVNTLPAWDNQGATGKGLPSYQLYPGGIDSYRLPPYIRLDLSITWQKNFGAWSLAPYLQIFNVGNRKNVWYIDYSSNEQDGAIIQTADPVDQLPFLPSIGVTAKF